MALVDTNIVKGNRTDDKIIKVILPRKEGVGVLEAEIPAELKGSLIRGRSYLYDAGYKDDGKPDPEKMKAECETIMVWIRVPKENESEVKRIIKDKPDSEVEEVTKDKEAEKKIKFKFYDEKDERIREVVLSAYMDDIENTSVGPLGNE